MDEVELAKILNQASREQLLKYLHELIKVHSHNLISDNNPCRMKMSILGKNFNKNDVVSYISSLPLVHCLDAWKYIGRAFQAVTRGDSPAACHLAYYAELRAAISILASQGIAVFEDHYTVVKSDGTYEDHELFFDNGRKMGTHNIAWSLLRKLCYYTNFTEILPRIVSVENHDLNDFLQNFNYGSKSLDVLWSNTLSEWGIDLKQMHQEQNRRNIASYLPNWFIINQNCQFKEIIKFSSNIWENLEYSNNSFVNLDRALFKITLESLRASKDWTEQDYFKELDKVLKNQGIPETSSLYKYLHESTVPDILRYAKDLSPGLFPNYEISMISRAILLSRISLGTVKLLLDDSNSLPAGVNTILSDYGIQYGIFDNAHEISTDLSVDILDIINKADKWYAETTTITPNNWNLFSKEGANIMTSFERVPIESLKINVNA